MNCKDASNYTYHLYQLLKYEGWNAEPTLKEKALEALLAAGHAIDAVMHTDEGPERFSAEMAAGRAVDEARRLYRDSLGGTKNIEPCGPITWGGYDGRAIYIDKRSAGQKGMTNEDFHNPRPMPAIITF